MPVKDIIGWSLVVIVAILSYFFYVFALAVCLLGGWVAGVACLLNMADSVYDKIQEWRKEE